MAATPETPDDAVVAELPWLRGLARRLADDDAEDLVQDLWLLARRDRPQARGGGLRPWLATAMRNRLRSVRRSATARSARERSWTSLGAGPSEPEQEAMAADLARVLEEALATLSEDDRALLRERFFDGRSAAQIAAAQGVPAATVRTRVRRSLQRLHEQLRRRHGDRPRAALAGAVAATLPSSRTITQGALMANMKGILVVGGVVGVAALGWTWAHRDPSQGASPTASASASTLPAGEASAAAREASAAPGENPTAPGEAAASGRGDDAGPDPRRAGPAATAGPVPARPDPAALAGYPAGGPTVRQCATAVHEHEDCDFLDPDPEVLEQMATCGVVRYDFPAMFAQADWTPRFEEEWLDLVGATGAEREQLVQIADGYRDQLFADLEAIGREVGLDPWPTDVTLLTAVVDLSKAVGDDQVVVASRVVAQERAGRVDPPEAIADRPAAERFVRLFTAVGSSFEDAIAAQLGPARARELRVAQDGWPGLKYQTGARCPD